MLLTGYKFENLYVIFFFVHLQEIIGKVDVWFSLIRAAHNVMTDRYKAT